MKAADCLCQNRSMHTRCIFSSTSLAKSQTIERIAIQLFIEWLSFIGKVFSAAFSMRYFIRDDRTFIHSFGNGWR